MKFVIILLIFSFFYLNISDGKAIPVAEDSTGGEDFSLARRSYCGEDYITFGNKPNCGRRCTWSDQDRRCVRSFRPNQSG